MSSDLDKVFEKKYPSYGEAVRNYIEIREIKQTDIVENILEEGQNERSLQQQMSKWLSGDPISKGYRKKIDSVLGISVEKDVEGAWRISRAKPEEQVYKRLETEEARQLFDRIRRYLASRSSEAPGDPTRRILLAFRDQLRSQQSQTHSMLQILDTLLDDE